MYVSMHAHTHTKTSNSNNGRFIIIFVTKFTRKSLAPKFLSWHPDSKKICQARIKSVKIICTNPVFYILCMSDFYEYCFNCTHLAMNSLPAYDYLKNFFQKNHTFIYVFVNLWNTQMNTIYLFCWHDGTVKNLYCFYYWWNISSTEFNHISEDNISPLSKSAMYTNPTRYIHVVVSGNSYST